MSSSSIFAIGVAIAGLVLFYRAALPKPIPGIPCNKAASKSILGDIPAMLNSLFQTGEIFNWLAVQTNKLQSPIVQVFPRPFYQPWVVITDYRESEDIMTRRTAEFDRSELMGDIFDGLIPQHHIHQRTSSPGFKNNRSLMRDVMTVSFLQTIAAPQVYTSALHLLELWNMKMKRVDGRPFMAKPDMFHCAFDIVFSVTFGRRKQLSALQPQIEFQSSAKLPNNCDGGIEFPSAPLPADFESFHTLDDAVELAMKTPMPRQTQWLIRQLPYMRRAYRAKEKFMDEEMASAVATFNPDTEQRQTCAMDRVLWREYVMAKKEDREPVYNQPALRDELFGFLLAGIDSTSTSMSWALKFVADHPEVQTKLRKCLREAYQEASAEGRLPTCDEIIKTPIPYLDCVMEECFRLMFTTGGVQRQALVDTEVLGYRIPKGTNLFLMSNGASIWTPTLPISDKLRQQSALNSRTQVPEWNADDVTQFRPERWLKEQDGKIVFSAKAGPTMNFGLGPRSCFGKRLAYLELRIMYVVIFWNFVLEKCPPELSSYRCIEKVTGVPEQCYVKLSRALR